MSLEKTQGYADAVKALEANMSPRAQHMATLERYVDGTQYAGLPDWFSDEKPLWERAPCIVYPIVRSAIASNADLLLGESRFPAVAVDGLEPGEESEAVEAVLAKLVQQARLKAVSREVFSAAQGTGSACAIFGLRGGRLFVDVTKARWCEVELDVDGAVRRLEIQYPYLTVESVAGQRRVVAKAYRRVIDATSDTTYVPAEARVDAAAIQWVVDEKRTVAHGLGFCPVVWYAHMRGCPIVGDVDGHALHEHLTDEIRAHDFALSQRHRAALYTGDPQWTETGVEPGYNPTGSVRRAEVPASISGRPGEKPHAAYVSRGPRGKARKKSPGVVWQYEDPNVQVKLHTLPGDALEALDKHARDLRIKLAESLGVVFLDPETMPAATTISGRALEALKARQIDRCDSYRADFGDRFLLPAMGMLLRIAWKAQLAVAGLEIVDRIVAKVGEQWSWHIPPLGLAWGRYFRLDADEEAKHVDLVIKAKDGGVTTTRAAVEKLRAVFDIKDVDAYLEELEEEKASAMKRQQQIAADMMKAGAIDDDDGDAADDEAEDDDGGAEPGTKPGPSRRPGPRKA